jgi:hypothetical protein
MSTAVLSLHLRQQHTLTFTPSKAFTASKASYAIASGSTCATAAAHGSSSPTGQAVDAAARTQIPDNLPVYIDVY